jgi:phosphoribosyl 1,2-cyclic phosphodiesterase
VKLTFCGTRGSVPVPERELDTFGGNTSCVMIAFDNGRITLLDAGTGIRRAGRLIAERGIAQFDNLIIGLSHTHGDHIQGFPFFAPACDPRRRLTLALSGHAGQTTDLESVFTTQMQQEFFPVPLTGMGAKIAFWQPEQDNLTMASGVQIRTERHGHPGGAHGYRITEGEKTVVYCTDVEHGERIDPGVVALARGADLLIHDAQYTPAELKAKRGWGAQQLGAGDRGRPRSEGRAARALPPRSGARRRIPARRRARVPAPLLERVPRAGGADGVAVAQTAATAGSRWAATT